MTLEVTGKLIEKYDSIQVSERFKKREFVLELAEEINGNVYTNYAKMQLVQAKCEIIDKFNVGDVLKVSFNIKGTKYEKDGKTNYFSNLDAWRVENAANAQPAAGQNMPNSNQGNYQNTNNNYSNPQGGNFGAQPGQGYSNSGNTNAPQDTPDDLPF